MAETQLPDLPTGYLRVVCRLGRAGIDAADAGDVPDITTLGGTVVLTTGAPRVRVAETDGHSRIVVLDEVTCQIVPDTGELMGPTGIIGVQVIDPATGVDPAGWTWSATVTPKVGGPLDPIHFDGAASVAGVVDLAATADMPSSAGVGTLTGRVEAIEATIGTLTVTQPTLTPDGSGGLIIDQL